MAGRWPATRPPWKPRPGMRCPAESVGSPIRGASAARSGRPPRTPANPRTVPTPQAAPRLPEESAAGRLARRPPVLVAHPPVAGATCGDADAAAGEAGPWEAGAESGAVEAGPWEGGPAEAGAAVSVLRGRPRPRLRAMTTPSTKISPPHTPHGSPRRRAPAKHSALIGQ